MGVLGIEGSFRLTAEKTLKVLRKNAVIIECILDVLRHDPLYQWYFELLIIVGRSLLFEPNKESEYLKDPNEVILYLILRMNPGLLKLRMFCLLLMVGLMVVGTRKLRELCFH
jgi:phosphatidylinositol kinase/protein kinase (PI-3  family)